MDESRRRFLKELGTVLGAGCALPLLDAACAAGERASAEQASAGPALPRSQWAMVVDTEKCRRDDVRRAAASAVTSPALVRAVLAAHVPAAIASVLSGAGVLALEADEAILPAIHAARSGSLPAASTGTADGSLVLQVAGGKATVRWVARGLERSWATAGTTRVKR